LRVLFKPNIADDTAGTERFEKLSAKPSLDDFALSGVARLMLAPL
jgi:hypothetical protein